MSKLLEDPKVAALVQKSVASAVKAENNRLRSIVKDSAAGAKALEDKATKTVVTGVLKDILIGMKIAA